MLEHVEGPDHVVLPLEWQLACVHLVKLDGWEARLRRAEAAVWSSLPATRKRGMRLTIQRSTQPVPQPTSKKLRALGNEVRTAHSIKRFRDANQKLSSSTRDSRRNDSSFMPASVSSRSGPNAGRRIDAPARTRSRCNASGHPPTLHRSVSSASLRFLGPIADARPTVAVAVVQEPSATMY